ncbi:MAG: leader peptidase (prepilin peptidase) / N-methyltransferase [Acidobacteriota bacterium]|nr:leader peptidase (prepilin peptidase) / N-methyltransferase [Acidobacteriota bacterium]
MSLQLLLGLYATVLGLIVGSYLNVVIYRLPLGISTVLPRSRCPECGAAIRARDNVPVVSFLLLRGRCRACGARISGRYPLIEGATALLFLGCYLRFGASFEALAGALFCALMVALAIIDLDHMILPDVLTWPGIVVGILLQPLLSWARLGPGPWRALAGGALGAAVGAGILLAVWGGWYLLRREEGMGLGDVKMLAAIGAFLGWQGVLVSLFFAALSGSAVGVGLMAWRGGDLRSKLPFGTFLALGGLIALFAGERIVEAYARLL